jgi:hypothetical protein
MRTRAEQETIYRWDREELALHGWTANRAEVLRWRALGYPVTEAGGEWQTQVPVEALALLPLKNGVVQTSRYISAPVLLVKPLAARNASNDVQISEQNRAFGPTSPQRTGGVTSDASA